MAHEEREKTMFYLSDTGWSRATVFFNIFLTGTKKQKSHIPKWFLSALYIDILIFWCLNKVKLEKKTEDNRRQQTPPDTLSPWQEYVWSVCWRMLSSVDIFSYVEMFEGWLGGVWVVSGGIWVVFMNTKGAQMCFGVYLGSPSLHYWVVTLIWHSPERHNWP